MNSMNEIFNVENLNFDQFSFFENFYDIQKNKSLIKLKKYFEMVDLEIKNSRNRYLSGWIIKDKRKRTILTQEGSFVFNRTRYLNKFTNEIKCLADDYLQIQKYARISNAFKIKILNLFGEGEGIRYKQILKMFPYCELSVQSISNIIKKTKITDEQINNAFFKAKKDYNKNTHFYVETDDTFFNVTEKRKKIKMRLRLFVVHNGVVFLNGKKTLKNKTFFYFLKKQGQTIANEAMIKQLISHIKYYYNFNLNDINNLSIHGDGAKWIKHLAEVLNREFVLDKFHLLKEKKHIFSFSSKRQITKQTKQNFEIFAKISCYLSSKNNKDYEKFILLLNKSLINFSIKKNPKLGKLITLLNYIKNNEKGILNLYKDYGSSHTEGQISCLIKQLFGYGKKIYSLSSIKNIFRIKQLKTNGFDFQNILLTSNNEKFFETNSINFDIGFKDYNDLDKTIRKYNLKSKYYRHFTVKKRI